MFFSDVPEDRHLVKYSPNVGRVCVSLLTPSWFDESSGLLGDDLAFVDSAKGFDTVRC